MPLLPIVCVILWWNVAVGLFLLVKCKTCHKSPMEDKYEYETLPVVHDDCNGFSARWVYLLRLSYGNHSRKFFIPNATITIHFFNSSKEKVATACLKPKLLMENHRQYLTRIFTRSKQHMLFVLFKRKAPMEDVELLMINHDMHGGSILIYNLYVLRLADSAVFGTKIGKTIHCLESGFDTDTQTFRYSCFGRCIDYVGPSLNLSPLETLSLAYVGMSAIFLFCIALLRCSATKPWCPHVKSLSHALKTSLYGGLVAMALTLALLLIYQCVFKRLNARWNNVGYIWLILQLLPYCIFSGCIATDIFSMWLLASSASASLDRRQKLWLITVALAAAIYLLALILLVMVLYLNGYYDSQISPKVDFESDKIQPIPSDQMPKGHQGNKRDQTQTRKSYSFSTRNLMIDSKLQEKSNLSQIHGESISKLIEANYAVPALKKLGSTRESKLN